MTANTAAVSPILGKPCRSEIGEKTPQIFDLGVSMGTRGFRLSNSSICVMKGFSG
jgi:hypothetical protein